MYLPLFIHANTRKTYASEHYVASFLDKILSDHIIRYEFIISVCKKDDPTPFLYITSEEKIEKDEIPFHYFLCIFETKSGKEVHINYGDHEDWSDPDRFETVALAMIEERVGQVLVSLADDIC